MKDYQKYINALRKCAKEHENDSTFTGYIIVSDLCRDTANLLEELEQEPKTGHWIEYTRVLIPEPFNEWEQAWYCSECGYGNQECEDGSAWLEWKYCPDCGAKMIESEDKK